MTDWKAEASKLEANTDWEKETRILKAKLAELEKSPKLNIKLGNKRNVVVGSGGGLGQRFPVSLYAPSWLVLLNPGNVERILEFIEKNKDQLSWGV